MPEGNPKRWGVEASPKALSGLYPRQRKGEGKSMSADPVTDPISILNALLDDRNYDAGDGFFPTIMQREELEKRRAGEVEDSSQAQRDWAGEELAGYERGARRRNVFAQITDIVFEIIDAHPEIFDDERKEWYRKEIAKLGENVEKSSGATRENPRPIARATALDARRLLIELKEELQKPKAKGIEPEIH